MLIIPGLFSVSQVKGSLYVKILNISDTWKKVIKPNAIASSEITDKDTIFDFIWKLHLTFQFLRYKISKISYNGK